MTILLFGKNGQVGQELHHYLNPLATLISLGQSHLNFTNTKALKKALEDLKPKIIVNAAAYTEVDKAEQEASKAYKINAQAVDIMADYAKKNDKLLIHYSSDYVFDGGKSSAYTELDQPNPQNIYGYSKLAGEEAISKSGCRNLIFRCSWIYSPWRHNFIKTLLKLARHQKSLSIIHDQYSIPTSAKFIAAMTQNALMTYHQGKLAEGIYHMTPNGYASRYELACYIIHQITKRGIDLAITTAQIKPVSSATYALIAKRPLSTILDNNKLSKQLNMMMPNWQAPIDEVLHQLIQFGFFK